MMGRLLLHEVDALRKEVVVAYGSFIFAAFKYIFAI
jgi:hypothetical protein